MNKELCNTHVDWEQRRYEIAKTVLPVTAVKYGWDNPIGEDSGRERKYDSQY